MSHIEKIILVVILVVLVLWLVTGKCSEGYGQDASIRAAAGWVAGPDYGFDPVQDYADQLALLRQKKKENYKNMSNQKCNCS